MVLSDEAIEARNNSLDVNEELKDVLQQLISIQVSRIESDAEVRTLVRQTSTDIRELGKAIREDAAISRKQLIGLFTKFLAFVAAILSAIGLFKLTGFL